MGGKIPRFVRAQIKANIQAEEMVLYDMKAELQAFELSIMDNEQLTFRIILYRHCFSGRKDTASLTYRGELSEALASAKKKHDTQSSSRERGGLICLVFVVLSNGSRIRIPRYLYEGMLERLQVRSAA